jgi:hypothetical protein
MRPLAFGLALLAVASSAAADDAGCAIARTAMGEDGVGTYVAECRWPVAAAFVSAIVASPSAMAATSSSLAESRKLADGRVLNVISPGWPLDDRQSTLKIEKRVLPDGGLHLVYALASVQEPLGDGRVQVRRDDGHWEIRSDGRGGCAIRYETTFDAGGNLPRSVVERGIPRHMGLSLRELRAAAEAAARRSAGASAR